MMNELPRGFVLRPLTPDDVPAARALMDACETADTGEPAVHDIDLSAESRSPRFDFEHSAWAIVVSDGGLAAVGWVRAPGGGGISQGEQWVRPDLRRLALDEVMLDHIEARAAEYARDPRRAGYEAFPLRLLVNCEPVIERRRELLLTRGFSVVQESFQMRLDLDGPLPPTRLPDGVLVRPARFGEDDRRLHAADEEAFVEHFGYEAWDFEEWSVHTLRDERIDPALWLVAWDGVEVAGQVRTLTRAGEAHVDSLGVRKPWRRRGIGVALLQETFRLLAERGYPFARLYVDAQNQTGALDLYIKAGMRIERRFEVFEKRFEPPRSA